MAVGSGAIGAVIGELTAEAAGKSMKPEDLVNLSRLLAGVAGAMTGGDVNLAATAGGNAAENNFLNHKRPSMLRLSEVEQYERAVEECKTNPAACQLRDSLAQLSAQRDRELQQACSGATPELCNQKAREATSMGNVVTGSNGGVVIASSTSPGPIKNLNVPTIGSPTDPRTGTFQDTLARSTAEALLLESGNQVALAIVGTALKAVGVTTQTVKNYFASTGVTISDDAAARIANNFYREGGDPKTIEAMFNSAASSSTRNASSGEVVLGKYVTGSSQSYEKVAIARGATYFEVPDWAATQLLLGEKEMWNINKAFLDQQIAQGKSFVFTGNPKLMSKGSYGAMEFEHLTKSGYKFTEKGGFFYGAK